MDTLPLRRKLADLNAVEFAAAARGAPVILLPLGSHEDHGPLLPMGDYVTAEILAARIAEMSSARGVDTFVAPALPFGVADYFGGSPGGLALSAANFRGVLEDLLGGLLRHGLTKIIILNGHGGNAPVIHEVTLRLRETQGLIIPSLYLWKVARAMLERSAPALSAGAFGHGGEPLFSVTGTLRPALVGEAAPPPGPAAKMLALPVSGFGTVAFQGLPIDVPATFEATAQGAAPAALAHAEPARGPALVAALVKFGVAFVAHVDRVARASAVSKSRSTESEATGSSKTNSM